LKLNKETKVGILVLVAGIILYVGFNFLKGNNLFASSKKYHIIYNNVEGLTVSNSVIINGFTVGRVEDVTILHDRNDSLLVTIDVKKEVTLVKGTSAKLASPDLLGGKVIELIQGDGKDELQTGAYLIAKKEKGLAATLEEKATPVLNTLDTAITNLSSYFDDDISRSIRNIVKNLETTTNYASLVMKQSNNILEANSNDIRSITANLEEISTKLNLLADNTNTLVGDKITTLIDTLNNLEINKIITSASNAADQLEDMMSSIDSSGGSLGKMIYDPKLYNNMNTTLKDLDFLLVDFQANPQRYINVSVFGGKVKEKSPIKKIKPSSFTEKIEIEFNDNYVPDDIEAIFYQMDSKQKFIPTSKTVNKSTLIFKLEDSMPSGEYIVKLIWNKGKNSELIEVVKK